MKRTCPDLEHKYHTHSHREYNISRVSSADNFLQDDITFAGHYFEPFSSAVPRFEMRFPLARLVKAEIVSPYYGILINTGMGSPNALLIAVSGERVPPGKWGGAKAFTASIKR